jgi:hypothetical protein
VVHTQAWFLRRCLTLYNDVVRRPHLPREEQIRNLLANTGIDLAQNGVRSSAQLVDDDDDVGMEECGESEGEIEVDPCC